MAKIVVLGAGLGGTIMAYELRDRLGQQHQVAVVNNGAAILRPVESLGGGRLAEPGGDRGRPDDSLAQRDIGCTAGRQARSSFRSASNSTTARRSITIISSSPPARNSPSTKSRASARSTTPSRSAKSTMRLHAKQAFDALVARPGPVVIGAVQGASCFGPAYEFAFILDKALRDAKVRDSVPMTFVTSEPYVGHLGLDGVGDTKGLLESEMRKHHIKWITNARVEPSRPTRWWHPRSPRTAPSGGARIASGLFDDAAGLPRCRSRPGHRGSDQSARVHPGRQAPAQSHIPGIFSIGVCVAIPPIGKTPVPVGVPKTGFMIESMVTATARNIERLIAGQQPDAEATWNAVCLADFGDGGIAFVAQPQIPPRNVNWSSSGKWVHAAKIGFEKYFLHKIRPANPNRSTSGWPSGARHRQAQGDQENRRD